MCSTIPHSCPMYNVNNCLFTVSKTIYLPQQYKEVSSITSDLCGTGSKLDETRNRYL